MFNIFKKKAVTPTRSDSKLYVGQFKETDYSDARGYNGYATHLRHGNSHEAVCGRQLLDGGRVITVEKLLGDLPRQHESFYYCAICASEFTGTSVEQLRKFRDS